ncbi:GH39 family glycosyl hydrolase [Thermoactinospora rubra]|uniref:GH39 family glycosyl hydrolase n=1 Tax=Thermoactinospora rubra TaxID=1088767 RepID=UPI001F0AE7FE|nr:xylan 1,4-beta-xylosidase [Thermoactinospora rubra]
MIGLLALLLIGGILGFAAMREPAPKGEPATAATSPAPPPSLDPAPPVENWPRWGITHTQFSADHEPAKVREQAAHMLEREPMLQNQHIMGWGAGNPEPSPGRYDFRQLDDRMKFISQSKGVPVITLCCAPDWMKGGTPGRTDWTKNATVAPKREHFDDFANLAARIAKRYPNVRHYMVWNEFKGFWDPVNQRWDAEAYTEMYNKVYDALKKVNPQIQVGGPYIPMDSTQRDAGSELKGPWGVMDQRVLDAIGYWLSEKKGADFIVVDGASMTTDKGNVPDDFGALAKFSAITTWLRQKSGDLPVWWAEWYIEPTNSGWSEAKRTAVQAVAMMEFAASGATTALYWNPQRETGKDCPGCLWVPGNGREMPMAGLLSGFTKWFPAGVPLAQVSVSDQRVRVLAQERMMVMVNTTDAELSATVDGKTVTLKPYEIKWSPRGVTG